MIPRVKEHRVHWHVSFLNNLGHGCQRTCLLLATLAATVAVTSAGTYKEARDLCDMDWPHGASRPFVEVFQHWDGLCCVCEEWDYFKSIGSAGSVIASQSSIFTAWVCAAYMAEWHQSFSEQSF